MQLPKFSLVEFNLSKATSSKLLWRTRNETISEKDYIELYSYVITKNNCFKSCSIDSMDTILATGERYGGAGCAGNGGGVRCANINGHQVKGIGTNPLVGDDTDYWYSHGSLNIIDATCEIIYGYLFDNLLPLGTVKCTGAIATTQDAGFFTESEDRDALETCWGALLVRENALRPAHFLSSEYYKPHRDYKNKIAKDIVRVRAANQALFKQYPSEELLHKFFIQFVESCAKQFAFAKLNRLVHGSLSPSNIAINGKWLDLSCSSTLPSGINYQVGYHQLPFFDEHRIVERVTLEWIDTCTKFNNILISAPAVIQHFYAMYQHQLFNNIGYVLGLPARSWPLNFDNATTEKLVGNICSLILKDSRIYQASPEGLMDNDPLVIELSSLYSTALGSNYNSAESHIDINLFLFAIEQSYKAQRTAISYKAYCTLICIYSIKRAMCGAVFYRGKLRNYLAANIKQDLRFYQSFIEEMTKSVDWIFEKNSGTDAIVFKHKNNLIAYSANADKYLLQTEKSVLQFTQFSALYEHCMQNERSIFVTPYFDYSNYLERLHLVLRNSGNP